MAGAPWTIGPTEVLEVADATVLRTRVDGVVVEVRGPRGSLAPAAEALPTAFAIPAARAGARLAGGPPVDPTWLAGARQNLLDVARWWPGGTALEVEPTQPANTATTAPPSGAARALCFTGGVDSFATLLGGDLDLTHLLYVEGFDVPLHDEPRLADVRALVHAVADALGLAALVVRTDLRTHHRFGPEPWLHTHGAAIAMVAHLLRPVVGTVVVSPTYEADRQLPCGTHPVLDPRWGVPGRTTLEHGDTSIGRRQRLAAIARHPLVREHLHVCWEHRTHDRNCGRCEKCVRTLVMLRAEGALADGFPAFAHVPFDDASLATRVRSFGEPPPTAVEFWRDLLDEDLGPELLEAIGEVLRPAAPSRSRSPSPALPEPPAVAAPRPKSPARLVLERLGLGDPPPVVSEPVPSPAAPPRPPPPPPPPISPAPEPHLRSAAGRRVLVVTTGGVRNVGDDATTLGVLDRLARVVDPDVRIELLTDGDRLPPLPSRYRWLGALGGAAAAHLAGAGALVIAAAGVLDEWFDDAVRPRAALAEAARAAGIPVIVTGAGIGAEPSAGTQRLLGLADAVATRDPSSAVLAEATCVGDDAAIAGSFQRWSPASPRTIVAHVRSAPYAPAGDDDRERWLRAIDAFAAIDGCTVTALAANDQSPSERSLVEAFSAGPTNAAWSIVDAVDDVALARSACGSARAAFVQSFHLAWFALEAGVPALLGARGAYYAAKGEGLAALAGLPAALAWHDGVVDVEALAARLRVVEPAVLRRRPLVGVDDAAARWLAQALAATGLAGPPR